MRSLWVARQLLHKLSSALTGDEQLLLKGCAAGVSTGPAEGDPFPRCTISPNLGDCGGPLLKCTGEAGMVLGAASPKLLYRACVKAINRRRLDGRADTPWRRELGLHGDTKPEWRVLCKPPLTKKAADLQWSPPWHCVSLIKLWRCLSVPHGDSSYMVYASTDSLRCFECGDIGHKRFACLPKDRAEPREDQASTSAERSGAGAEDSAGKPPLDPGVGVRASVGGRGAEVSERLVASGLENEGSTMQAGQGECGAGAQTGGDGGEVRLSEISD
ncbi:hypothetical protein NFI96_007830 [Prochilodus magdalenae]|nr:hypothetical protein NFI96_007830 [Prochilodus magdalenae]